MTRWVGIDEAGYGPNLGPLVMTAVTAESPDDREPDLWRDLAGRVSRVGGTEQALWVDDSKALFTGRTGRTRLEDAALATIAATGRALPTSLSALFEAVGAGSLADVELDRWLSGECAWKAPPRSTYPDMSCDAWRLVDLRSVVIGPERFNAELSGAASKAVVHFGAFARLLRFHWETSGLDVATRIRGDKHGGRNFYAGPLSDALADSWVTPEVEGPDLSRYTIKGPGRALAVEFRPKADSHDGLVALASIISKFLREVWMDEFNAFWLKHVPGLTPSAGYPVDAARFRKEIESAAKELGLPAELWWRRK